MGKSNHQLETSGLSSAITTNADTLQGCQHLLMRQRLNAWETITRDKVLLTAIQRGVRAPIQCIPQPNDKRTRTRDNTDLATTIGDYLEAGVISRLDPTQTAKTKYWVPIFGRPKKDSDKVRMITDLRDLNQCHTIERHRPQTWHQVCKLLREERGQWALTLDLKGYFHHLGIHPKTRRWMRFKHNGQGYQIEAMPFGWSMSPFWAHRMSKPIRALLNQWNVPHAWWVDDILILGRDKADVCTSATRLINLLTKLGVCINPSKSMSQPAQEFTYLGHHWNLVTNRLTPLQPKVASAIQDCKHQLKSNVTTPYHLASLAGKLLDSNKSNTALTGLPQQIMRLAGKLAARTAYFNPQLTLKQAWRKSTAKTALQQHTQPTSQAAPPPPLQRTLQTALQALQQPVPRVFRSSQQPLTMQTDASEKAWGATLIKDKHELATSADVWTTRQSALHITHRECLATALALSHMERLLPPNSHLHVQTDSMATALAWKNGSKNTIMNHIVRPCLMRLHAKGIFTTAEHIPGTTNRRADWLSRNPDPKNYQLDQSLFKRICHRHNFWPTIDLFASRHNRQLQRYCSWRMDRKSQGNALQLDWAKERGWMNPPWDLIPQCLQKIKDNKATVLCCLPHWPTAHWWRDLCRRRKSTALGRAGDRESVLYIVAGGET